MSSRRQNQLLPSHFQLALEKITLFPCCKKIVSNQLCQQKYLCGCFLQNKKIGSAFRHISKDLPISISSSSFRTSFSLMHTFIVLRFNASKIYLQQWQTLFLLVFQHKQAIELYISLQIPYDSCHTKNHQAKKQSCSRCLIDRGDTFYNYTSEFGT